MKEEKREEGRRERGESETDRQVHEMAMKRLLENRLTIYIRNGRWVKRCGRPQEDQRKVT